MSVPVAVAVRQRPSLTSHRDAPVPIAVRIVTGGLRGPSGSGSGTAAPAFEYVQAVPALTWTVVHNLGITPSAIAAYDTNGNEMVCNVRVIDLNSIELSFAVPTAGKVEIR